MKSTLTSLACALLLVSLSTISEADIGIPDLSHSYATSNAGCIMITPEGTGPTLASRNLTVTVGLRDALDLPIPNYPFQDIWLHNEVADELYMCQNGSLADANTDANGETTISGALAGGGSTQLGMRVYVAGMPIGDGPLAIEVVSPDLNADLFVNMADLGTFATLYLTPEYDLPADLSCDGLEDLRDIAAFAAHLIDTCP